MLLLLALTIGCTPAESWHGTIEERDGVTHVRNPRVGLWQVREPEPLRFDLEQVFGVDQSPEEAIIGGIGGVTVDESGNVYVYDYQAYRLMSFAPDGELRWAHGRQGQGPGEFNGAEGIAWDGRSTIYISNANRMRLDAWSLDGAFLRTEPLGERGLPTGALLGFLDPDRLALASFMVNFDTNIGGSFAIIEVGESLREIADVRVDVESSDPGQSFALVSMRVSGAAVTIGDVDSYELRFYDRDGALVRLVSREFEEMVGYATDGRRPPRSWLFPPVQLNGGYWLAHSQWADSGLAENDPDQFSGGTDDDAQWRSALDLFDAEGRFLYSEVGEGRTPLIGRIQTVGPDGKLYTSSSDPFPQVRRYRVEIDSR